jgi:hypothetical protein
MQNDTSKHGISLVHVRMRSSRRRFLPLVSQVWAWWIDRLKYMTWKMKITGA